ncbi:hypothetical protein [Cellulomonas sp. URHE0023]|uniref:hypothetical protein n=1 Tax=Cellulomonas sp. URHE0023 TaxID=1380354 RepID=UPI0004801504|nr:hypothetical protein [Cellulomonas sp. URHE0023]
MSVDYQYFGAASVKAAAEVAHRTDGPGSPPAKRKGKKKVSKKDREAAPRFTVVDAPMIDPYVVAGTLTSLLTGRSYEDIVDDLDWGDVVAEGPAGHLVIATTDAFVKALAASDDSALTAIAEPWSHTEELEGIAVERLTATLHELAALARAARVEKARIYCWVGSRTGS